MNSSQEKITDLYEDPEVYDLFCSDFGGESFFVDLSGESTGGCLELACGTGRIIGAIGGQGRKCYGLDMSEPMVRFARSRFPDIEFVVGDMTNFQVSHRFGCIILAANTIQQLLDVGDWAKVFQMAFEHLDKGGEFVISLVNTSKTMLQNTSGEVYSSTYEDPKGRGLIRILHSFSYDRATRIGSTNWHHLDEGGVLIARNLFKMLYLPPAEVVELAMDAGFGQTISYGGFDRVPLDSTSPLQVHRFTKS